MVWEPLLLATSTLSQEISSLSSWPAKCGPAALFLGAFSGLWRKELPLASSSSSRMCVLDSLVPSCSLRRSGDQWDDLAESSRMNWTFAASLSSRGEISLPSYLMASSSAEQMLEAKTWRGTLAMDWASLMSEPLMEEQKSASWGTNPPSPMLSFTGREMISASTSST